MYRERYARHVARQDTSSFVAELDGAVVGFISVEFRERLNRANLEAWIPDLIVTEGARGKGLGRGLLQAAFDLARERGCYHVTLESGYSRKTAHQLYRSAGMEDGGLFFGRPAPREEQGG
ncbi:MAG: GNAT family N-acetyltransferase [Chloroflexota bacterium]